MIIWQLVPPWPKELMPARLIDALGQGICILDRAQVQFLILCLKNVVALASETASMTKLALPLELGME